MLLGLGLRIALLLWGEYQDSTATVPYTDVDYSVYNDGARLIWASCPLSETIDSPLYGDEEDLLNKPHLFEHVHCARGIVPAVSRFVLKNDPARPDAAEMEWDSAWTAFLHTSYALTRPLFRFLGSLGDPFERATYRYTPLLACALAPAHALPGDTWKWFGKLLFALADVGCAVLMWALLDQRRAMHAHEAPGLAGASLTHLPGILWLLNPFPAQIATRGSADSLVGLIVLGFLYCLIRATPELSLIRSPEPNEPPKERHDAGELRVANTPCFYAAAFFMALAVHFKIYPIIYSPSVLAHLANYRQHALALLCGISKPRRQDVWRLGMEFGACAAFFYLVLTGLTWAIWGQPYIRHALLYHVVRQDHRHNFSVYFLPIYLSLDKVIGSGWTQWLYSPLLSFLPQFLTVSIAGFALGGLDLVLACAVQTVVFVAWNKVYTSQYFLWYLWFLPMVGVTMHFSSLAEIGCLVIMWVGAQALWLYHAYQLEFLAQDTFLALWLSSLVLLLVQLACTQRCLTAWVQWRRRQTIAIHKTQ